MALDVLVIGAGQAGLAAAHYLGQRGLQFAVADGCERVGDSWRKRYASLTLFTPRSLSSLPGRPLSGDPEGYAGRDEFADYLEGYASQFGSAILTRTPIVRLERAGDDGFVATGPDRSLEARRVIVATGAFVKPLVPSLASQFSPDVRQLTTETYKSPEDATGRVLVVGDGASGRDIAMDLAPHTRSALATGKPRRLLPERILGRSTWWWLVKLGLLQAGPNSPIGKLMQRSDPFPNRNRSIPDLRRAGVELRPRATAAHGRTVDFSDGSSDAFDTIIWAVGYRDSFEWLQIEGALDKSGRAIQSEGLSSATGLYFLGRPWMRNRASSLILGAAPDARRLVDRLATSTAR